MKKTITFKETIYELKDNKGNLLMDSYFFGSLQDYQFKYYSNENTSIHEKIINRF